MFKILCIALILVASPLVNGHARLRLPAARTSAFLLGFTNVPADYNDFQQNCGGYEKKVALKGACGICGDAADANPKDSEGPNGKYATGTIVKTYKSGETIDVEIEMQANHMGWFWFKLCPVSGTAEATQSCLDSHKLEIVSAPSALGSDKTVWKIPDQNAQGGSIYKFKVKLPSITCERCVLQWDWLCANRPNGNLAMCDNNVINPSNCAMQETFRGCADIKIG
jgi:hypothetical protein